MILQKPHQRNIARPPLPWTVRLTVSMVSALADNAFRSNGTASRRLINLLDYQTPPYSTTAVSSTDITIDATCNLWVRVYSPSLHPSNNQQLPVLIFFHGGGFTFLSPATLVYDMVCRNFATKVPAIIISVNYRLAPEHRYPSQYIDGFDALNFIDQNWIKVLPKNADQTRCFFTGDSAGANLAHHVAVQACRTKLRTMKIIGMISIQPFLGGEQRTESEMKLVGPLIPSVPRTDWCWKAFLPVGSNRDHAAANVSGPNADDISELDFPATLVVVGGFDPLKDWQRKYYDWLLKSGKEVSLMEYPNMIHAFYIFPHLPEASHLVLQIKKFIAKCSSRVSSVKSETSLSQAQVQASPRKINIIRLPILYWILSFILCIFFLCTSFFFNYQMFILCIFFFI